MSRPTMVTFNTLGGGMDCAAALEGFEILHRSGTLSFGEHGPETNRRITGWDWDTSFGEDERSWRVIPGVDAIFSNPPCLAALPRRSQDVIIAEPM